MAIPTMKQRGLLLNSSVASQAATKLNDYAHHQCQPIYF